MSDTSRADNGVLYPVKQQTWPPVSANLVIAIALGIDGRIDNVLSQSDRTEACLRPYSAIPCQATWMAIHMNEVLSKLRPFIGLTVVLVALFIWVFVSLIRSRARLRRLQEQGKCISLAQLKTGDALVRMILDIDFGSGPEFWTISQESINIDLLNVIDKEIIGGRMIYPRPRRKDVVKFADATSVEVVRLSYFRLRGLLSAIQGQTEVNRNKIQ